MIGLYAEFFQNRLVNLVYNPSELDHLTLEEKIPEFFNNSYDENSKNSMIQRIEYYTNFITDELGYVLANRIIDDEEKYIVHDFKEFPKLISIPELIQQNKFTEEELKQYIDEDKCDYIEDYSLLDSWEYVKYKENGKVYCLSIYNLTDTNPYTNNKFNDEFLEKISKFRKDKKFLKDKYLDRKEDLERKSLETRVKEFELQHEIFGEVLEGYQPTDFLSFVLQNIKELEEKLSEEKNTENCEYCEKHITSENSLNTILKYDRDSKIVKFCTVTCFEKWNPPKPKIQQEEVAPEVEEEIGEEIGEEISEGDKDIFVF